MNKDDVTNTIAMLTDVEEQCDELTAWWNRYQGGMITKDEMLNHVEAFVVWHVAQDITKGNA